MSISKGPAKLVITAECTRIGSLKKDVNDSKCLVAFNASDFVHGNAGTLQQVFYG